MNKFVKYHGQNTKRDWVRVNFFHKLSLRKKSFLFPQPLAYSENSIVYEKLENMLLLTDSLSVENCYEVMAKTGKALADIHNTQLKANQILLHSDFGLINLAWSPKKGIPIIFDPLPARFFWYDSYFGSRYYDICQLLASIFTINLFIKIVKLSPKLPMLMTQAFIQGYEKRSGFNLLTGSLVKFSKKIHEKYYTNRIAETNDVRYTVAFPLILFLRFLMIKVLKCR